MSWGIKHAAIETMYEYTGDILPLLTYGAPVWIDDMKYEHNIQKYIRVQRLINIRMAKAYRTTSSEALCILKGMTPIIINHLTPNGYYMGRTAQLTSRYCILYIYSANIRTEYFKHAV